jgi:hypothetical protein
MVLVSMQLILGVLLRGNVVALNENARHGSVRLYDRLIHEIGIPLFGRYSGLTPQDEAHFPADVRPAGRVDVV